MTGHRNRAFYSEGIGDFVPGPLFDDAIEAAEFKARPPIRITVVAPDDGWPIHADHLRRGWTAYGDCPVCIRRGRT